MTNRPELDYTYLDRELDRTKTKVFLSRNKYAAFLGPLMCSLNFMWTEDIKTAAVNATSLIWNPRFFLWLSPEEREAILMHELWHPALLHHLRRGSRDAYWWNVAADIVINNQLDHEGYTFGKFKPWIRHEYDNMPTEDVYDALMVKYGFGPEMTVELDDGTVLTPPSSEEDDSPFKPWLVDEDSETDESDIVEPEDETEEHASVNIVVRAAHSATMSGGDMPGEVEVTLKRFLAPKLPWPQILNNFFSELSEQDYTWARPNRRYQDMYLPSLAEDNGGLSHILYVQDVSGSITDADSIRFNSELKHIKEFYRPEKMTFAQFDVIIQRIDVFEQDDPFDEIKIVGRGSTDLTCVRNLIIELKPTAVVVFSDMQCLPMEPLPSDAIVPIIWVALNNREAKVPHGTIVHLTE